jgi:hypothetical protein
VDGELGEIDLMNGDWEAAQGASAGAAIDPEQPLAQRRSQRFEHSEVEKEERDGRGGPQVETGIGAGILDGISELSAPGGGTAPFAPAKRNCAGGEPASGS